MEEVARNFSSRAFVAWRRSRDRNPKEKEDKEMYGSFRKSFSKSWHLKRSDDNGAVSGDTSDHCQSDLQRISLTASKLPCQSFGSAQSQVYPQDEVPSLNKRDRFSHSARQHGERRRVPDERRRLSDVGVQTMKNEESSEASRGLYKRFDRLSCSARHPEMDCSFSRSSFSKESRNSIRDKVQKHEISFLKTPAEIGSTAILKEPKDSDNNEFFQNFQKPDNAREHFLKTSSSSYSEERFIDNPSGKSGCKKCTDKHLKSGKSLSSCRTNEARSRAAALQQWFKHIIRRKRSQNIKNGQHENYHTYEQDHSICINAKSSNDILEWGVLKDRNYNSSGHYFRGSSSIRMSKACDDDHELIPHLQRSSSVPHSESSYAYQNIHAEMPRLSEASAGSLRRFSIIESKELEALESEEVFFPRRRHRESIHKRSFFPEKPKDLLLHNIARTAENKAHLEVDNIDCLNSFLRRQKMKLSNVPPEDCSERVKIILSGPDLSLSSMVAAICYAWLLEHTATLDGWNPVPVINTTRKKMWEHRPAAWLFHHCGLDGRALFFCDEVDLESLVHSRQLNILVIGQDALGTDDEVASVCTILVEEYRKHACDLLQHPYIRKLLLAGILIDTQNLDPTAVFFTTRDKMAVDLLLVGASQYNCNALFGQLNQDHTDNSLEEAMQSNYGVPSNDSELVEGDEEDESLSQKNDVSGLFQLEDNVRCSSANSFDDLVYSHHENSLPKPGVLGVKVKSNWTVAKWFGFGSRQSVKI
ncbi:uncharacterized protein LOC131070755 isoform X1 [Cryptomeria japonica]|uniref:uncharacterized protein LOC131070755 isoform X1 n=1 Tax=Cryptomeria japonica TaxID=3369 RepID=UPI0025AD5590|nr:uncharacterized protein LOC131070755 isoform X1 [Cryptomeria japonica]